MTNSIWSVLELRATRDISEIKRAYAAKLKTIDLDADTAAYQALREARDIAIRLAQQPIEQDMPGWKGDLGTAPGDGRPDGVAVEEAVSHAPERPSEPLDPAEQELSEHQQALSALLFDFHDDTFYAATPEEERAMLLHFEAIATNPILQRIETLTNGSHWFAGAIAQMTPRSDVLIEPAAAVFGWDQADELGADPALAAVMQRRADLRFRDELSQPDHRLHKAWNELLTPANENSRRSRMRRKKVLELLSKIRGEHPTLERQLDWYRVEMWENQAWWQEGQNYGWAFFAIFIAIRIAVAVGGDTTPSTSQGFVPPVSYEQPPAAPLTTAANDIDNAIRDYTGGRIDGERLQSANPKLHQFLKMVWYGKQEAGAPMMEFEGRVRQLLNEQLQSQWAYADGDLLVERFELSRDIAKSMAASSAEACSRFLTHGDQPLHQLHRAREGELTAKRILAIDPDEPRKDGGTTSFSLPASVVTDVSERSGVEDPELSRALSLKGDALPLCKVRLALLDTVLDLPPTQRTKILRDMSID